MKHLNIFLKRLSESTTSCMVMMTQGNLLAITVYHWQKALQVGLIASVATLAVVIYGNKDWADNKFAMAGIIGFFTAVADMMTHPTHFGGPSTEAIVTGIGAGLLCLTMCKVWSKNS
jgi:hypothetical protein